MRLDLSSIWCDSALYDPQEPASDVKNQALEPVHKALQWHLLQDETMTASQALSNKGTTVQV